ncbi:MAG: 30S ribosomal protein S17 [Gemmatimonadales bacterium]|nr:MAG: 30S ribosomal protein S17 [Gemmatimonadales bacterium]
MTETTTAARNRRKIRQGTVASDKMTGTVVVELTRRFAHATYGKRITRTTRLKARDTLGAKTGDTVRIMETRPIAKTVSWRVIEIVVKAK